MLALRQQVFGIPSLDTNKVDEILNDPTLVIDTNSTAADKSQGNFYLVPEIDSNADFAKTKLAIKLSDLSIKSTVSVNNTIADLDKASWENFWQLFNLIQEHLIVINPKD